MIQYFPVVTGSLTVLGNINVSGSITTSGSITISGSITSASFASTASFVANAESASNAVAAQTASFVANAQTASYVLNAVSSSFASTASFVALAQSASNAVSAVTASFANNLTVAGTLTAQTLVVQTVTSSVIYSSGSNVFGNNIANTQVLTGSVNITGSGPHTIFGNVVIGNTTSVNANAKLEVKGECFITPIGTTASKLHLYNNDSTNETYIYDSGSATNSMLVFSPGGTIKALMISNSGNVSIGTSVAPAVNGLGLAIYASDYPRITLRNSTSGDTTGDGLQIAMVGANVQYDLAESGYQMWTTGGTERLRITSAGSVGIGTTSPVQKLDVLGNGNFGGVSTPYIDFKSTDTTGVGWSYKQISFKDATNAELYAIGYTWPNLTFDVSGSRVMTLTTAKETILSGVLYLNQTSLATVNANATAIGINGIYWMNRGSGSGLYHVLFGNGGNLVGSITSNTTNTQFNTSSDYRLKKDLKDFNALDILSNIKLYDFAWKLNDSRMYGVMAHELKEILPYAIVGEKDELDENGNIKSQGVDYSLLTPVLAKAIQELNTKFEEYKATHP